MISATAGGAKEKLHALKRLLERLSRELTKDESIQFPNLFSRLVLSHKNSDFPTVGVAATTYIDQADSK